MYLLDFLQDGALSLSALSIGAQWLKSVHIISMLLVDTTQQKFDTNFHTDNGSYTVVPV